MSRWPFVERTAEEDAVSVHSLSGSVPHPFGEHFDAFDEKLTQLLVEANAEGWYSEQMRSID